MAASRLECSFDGCEKPRTAFGLCQGHDYQSKQGQELRPLRRYVRQGPDCRFTGCAEIPRTRGLCLGHYDQLKRGAELAPLRKRRSVLADEWYPNGAGYLGKVRNGKLIFQHRWVMEQYLGRPLLPEENVHHKNGDRADNRIENLELWNTSQPSGQRAEDKLAWARQIIELYGGTE